MSLQGHVLQLQKRGPGAIGNDTETCLVHGQDKAVMRTSKVQGWEQTSSCNRHGSEPVVVLPFEGVDAATALVCYRGEWWPRH
jgi:hypothetical protein